MMIRRKKRQPTPAVVERHGGVTERREPIGSDSAAEVPRDQWGELLASRQEFCKYVLPRDCRMLLFFIQDAAANDWLGLGGREQYIRDGLKLDPQMVDWALDGLKTTRPDEVVKFADAAKLGKANHAGPGRGNKKTDSNTTRLNDRGSVYIRARLERDAAHHDDPMKREQAARLLTGVQSGEITAHRAAVEAGFRTRMVQHPATVEGFRHAIERHLSLEQQTELSASLTPSRKERQL